MSDASMMGLSREIEAAKLLKEQIADIAGNDPEFMRDAVEGETSLREILSAIVAEEREDQALINGIEALVEKLKARMERLARRIETRRSLMGLGLEVAGLTKLETPAGTLSLAKVAPKLIVQEEAAIPSEFWKAAPPKLDRKALADAIKGGRTIEGATLSNGSQTVKIL